MWDQWVVKVQVQVTTRSMLNSASHQLLGFGCVVFVLPRAGAARGAPFKKSPPMRPSGAAAGFAGDQPNDDEFLAEEEQQPMPSDKTEADTKIVGGQKIQQEAKEKDSGLNTTIVCNDTSCDYSIGNFVNLRAF